LLPRQDLRIDIFRRGPNHAFSRFPVRAFAISLSLCGVVRGESMGNAFGPNMRLLTASSNCPYLLRTVVDIGLPAGKNVGCLG
jgi:hypothetical protein